MKYILSFVFVLSLTIRAIAQIGFEEQIIEDLTNFIRAPYSIHVSDADGDDDMDVFVASWDSNGKIVWFPNEGEGNFGNYNTIDSGLQGTSDIFVIDLDGDGDVDVLASSSVFNKIMWYENIDGHGNFGSEKVITTNAVGAISVFAIDIDGDSFIDVVSASHSDNIIAWYKNLNGNGVFGAQQVISTATDRPRSVYAADLDGDGDQDVLSASQFDDKIAWYENIDGVGTFSTQQIITSDASGAQCVTTSDIDGDGDIDVLSASHEDDKIAWYENIDGLGSFGAPMIISLNADGASSVFAIDIDGDNDIDVISSSGDDDKVAWYENIDGAGTFNSEQIITLGAIYAQSVFASDIDDDGFVDVQSVSFTDDKVSWYKNLDGQGNFSYLKNIGAYISDPKAVISTDIDGDGYLDIVSTTNKPNGGYHDIVWYRNMDGLGRFDSQRVIVGVDDHLKYIHSCDIDGDNDMDMLSVAGNSFHISWYENLDGQGNFGEFQSIGSSIMPDFIHSTDIDGDGDIDILMSSNYRDEIAWYENLDGQGNFGTQNMITTSLEGPTSLYAVDIDGDGDNDVISSSAADDTIAWHENLDGQGSFGLLKVISWEADAAISVFAADIDGDNDMDVISASIVDNKIAWYENLDGQGNFGGINTISNLASSARGVFATDIDGDNDIDVLSASGNKIAWYENTDGLGTFTDQQIIGIDNYALSVYSADIDNDGDMDVLSCYNHGVNLYKNIGNLGFSEYPLLNFNIYPNPTTGILLINSKKNITQVNIFNKLGQLVFRDIDKNSIDMSSLKNGIYFMKIVDENGTTGVKKVIKL